jgi:hypothetical protein
VQFVERRIANPGYQELQSPNVAGNASFMLVFQHKLGGRLFERPLGPHTIDTCLPLLFN